jgi:hypothetical protein
MDRNTSSLEVFAPPKLLCHLPKGPTVDLTTSRPFNQRSIIVTTNLIIMCDIPVMDLITSPPMASQSSREQSLSPSPTPAPRERQGQQQQQRRIVIDLTTPSPPNVINTNPNTHTNPKANPNILETPQPARPSPQGPIQQHSARLPHHPQTPQPTTTTTPVVSSTYAQLQDPDYNLLSILGKPHLAQYPRSLS